MTIGDRIKQKREELNLSQDELAKRLGYKSRSSINKLELNQRNLTQSKIKAIADALETTPAYIMGWDEPMERNIYEDHNDLKRKAIKDKFLESEFGSSLKECIMAWDNAINEFHIHPFYSEDFKRSYKVNYRCQVQWEVYKMAIKEFYGIEYFFTRTDEYFGVCTEDETDWLFKVNRADVEGGE